MKTKWAKGQLTPLQWKTRKQRNLDWVAAEGWADISTAYRGVTDIRLNRRFGHPDYAVNLHCSNDLWKLGMLGEWHESPQAALFAWELTKDDLD